MHKYLYANGDPVGGWDPSGNFLVWNFVVGNKVHKAIGEDFVRRGYGFSDWALGRVGVTSAMFRLLRPDLITPATEHTPGFIWEIKSALTGYAAAAAQVALYLGVLNTQDPEKHLWLPGMHYLPPPVIFIESGTFALTRSAGPGVILYEVVNGYEAVTLFAAVVAAERSAILADLATALFIRTLGSPA